MKLLYLLAKADLFGRECKYKDNLLNNIEYFKEYCIDLGCYEDKKVFKNSYTRYKYLNSINTKTLHPEDELFDVTKFEVIVMCGLPLSGKDTFIKENLIDIPLISLDQIRDEFKILPRQDSNKVVAIAKERAKIYLRQKKTFIWNATNIMEDTRKKLCYLFSSYNARVHFIYIESTYKELLKRNKKRERSIDIKVLNHMIYKFDMIEPYEGYFTEYVVIN